MPRFNPLLPVVSRPCYKYVIKGDSDGQNVINTLYFIQSPGATTVPSLGDLNAAITAAIMPTFLDCLSTDYTKRQTTLYRFDDPTQLPNIRLEEDAGNVAGDSLPSFCTIDMYRFTKWGGQRGRGMLRLGTIGESSTIENRIAAAFVPTVAAFRDALMVPVGTANPTDGTFVSALLTRTIAFDPVPAVTVRGDVLVDTEYRSLLGSQLTRKWRGPA